MIENNIEDVADDLGRVHFAYELAANDPQQKVN
jgi:hypothetical protein